MLILSFLYAAPSPELLTPPENVTVSAYSKVKLSCTGRGFGDVQVVWTRPPSKVTTTAQYSTERFDDKIVSTLTIPHAVEIYSGTYCCAIANHVGSSDIQCASVKVNSEFSSLYTLKYQKKTATSLINFRACLMLHFV